MRVLRSLHVLTFLGGMALVGLLSGCTDAGGTTATTVVEEDKAQTEASRQATAEFYKNRGSQKKR